MAKERGWFSALKKIFISETNSRFEKKEKKERWLYRFLQGSGPSPQPQHETEEEQRAGGAVAEKQAEAAATESVPCIGNIENDHQQSRESSLDKCIHVDSFQYDRAIQDFAATRIQAVFRGYLGRKALRALRGVVKLQALIRGWAVRQQAINTLMCLQSIVNIQSDICSNRRERIKESSYFQELKFPDNGDKEIKIDSNSQKKGGESLLIRKESKALFLSNREATVKRERNKEYYMYHRRSAESERDKVYGRQRYWLEQWVEAQLARRNDLANLERTFPSSSRNREESSSRNLQNKHTHKNETADPPLHVPRRNFHHRKQRSIGDGGSSPAIPAYMASTESAKAKARSLSSPRQRPINSDVCSEINSPYKHSLSPMSSSNRELTSSGWLRNHTQRSPRLKGMQVQVLGLHHHHQIMNQAKP